MRQPQRPYPHEPTRREPFAQFRDHGTLHRWRMPLHDQSARRPTDASIVSHEGILRPLDIEFHQVVGTRRSRLDLRGVDEWH